MEIYNESLVEVVDVVVDEEKPVSGCEFYDDCLSCPYKVCKEDVGYKSFIRITQLDEIASMHGKGVSPADIAKEIGVCERTIQRRLYKLGLGGVNY